MFQCEGEAVLRNIRIGLSCLDNLAIVAMRKKLEKVTAHIQRARQDWVPETIFPVDLELEDPTPSGREYDA